MTTRYPLIRLQPGLWFFAALLALIVPATGINWVPPDEQSNQATTQPEPKTAVQKMRDAKARREARKARSRKQEPAASQPERTEEPVVSKPEATQPSASQPATRPAASAPAEKTDIPQVELYIPSVTQLRTEADRSKTAAIYRAISGMLPSQQDETGEGLDLGDVVKLVDQIAKWPDTSVVFSIYSMDREGRPRWALRVDWPLDELRQRISELLESEAARELLKGVKLTESDVGIWRLELPDYVLAVLSKSGEGSLVASTADLKPPAAVFGQEGFGKSEEAAAAKKKSRKPMLLYSRLNLGADEDDGTSPFAMISGVRDVCYGITLGKDGVWSEKLVVRWNPLLGTALKTVFRKMDKPFECPRDAYAVAAFNLSVGEGLADELGDLPPGTIGSKAASPMAFAAVPGTGFLPFPDLYYQFNAPKKDKIIASIREAIEEDAKKRKEEDKLLAWHEEKVDERVMFWRDPSADSAAGLMPARYRTVLFFDSPEDEDAGPARLIIAQTTTAASDAARHWKELTKSKKSRITIPDSTKIHWQARINWRSVYALAQPYLCVLSSVEEDTSLPPTVEDLAESLTPSILNIRIDYTGFEIRHAGPIPAGAIYVPAIIGLALSDSGNAWSEAGRERTACQHLRVLYYHAKLFRKDYGRWPATVAELDGYVDFAAHPDLLWLWQQDRSFMERVASSFTAKKPKLREKEDGELDDSLYEIDWTPTDWKLKFRDGEFKSYATIYIDAEGEIHRVPKPAASQPAAADGESAGKEKGSNNGKDR